MLKKLLPPLIAGLSAFLLIFGVSTYTNLFTGMERALLNGFYFVREPGIGEANPFVSRRVKLLGYDEDAIAVIGKWPWKRYVHAEFLRKIEKFSPETVFFDIIFAKPESVPPYIRKKLHPAPEILRRVEAAFAEMDGEFARALADYPNVYIDLQLIEEPRTSLPEAFKQRIRLTEQVISKYALPAGNVQSPVVFYSLEPILDSYVTRAHPVVVNALPDDDGVIRMFPLFYSYRMSDGSYRNIFTVVLALLQRYYHVDMSRVTILPDRVVLRDARDPVLDPETGRPTLFSRFLSTLTGEILTPRPRRTTPTTATCIGSWFTGCGATPAAVEKFPISRCMFCFAGTTDWKLSTAGRCWTRPDRPGPTPFTWWFTGKRMSKSTCR